jgi:hypothetical protein
MKIKEIRYGDDSVHAVLTLKTVNVAMLQRAKLYMAYVEDTVFYEAPNGETEHYDVFRKAFTPGDGILVFLPSNGDSATINLRLDVNSEWVLNRMSVIAILQDENSKEVLQAGKTTKLEINGPTFIDTRNSLEKTIKAFPNPARDKLYVEKVFGKVSLSSIDGRVVRNYYSAESDQLLEIEVSDLPEGLYVLRSKDASGMVSIKR